MLMDKSISSERVCHIQPIRVNKTATFIVDIDDVPFSDLKADNLGVWVPKGMKSVYFTSQQMVLFEWRLASQAIQRDHVI